VLFEDVVRAGRNGEPAALEGIDENIEIGLGGLRRRRDRRDEAMIHRIAPLAPPLILPDVAERVPGLPKSY